MGPLLARFNHTKISMPGGCAIGTRPIDLHLKGFKYLGAKVDMDHGFVEATAEKLIGSKLYLDFPSVGATENINDGSCTCRRNNYNRKCSRRTRNSRFSKLLK